MRRRLARWWRRHPGGSRVLAVLLAIVLVAHPLAPALKVAHDPAPVEARPDLNAAAAGSLGGGVAQPVAPPIDLRLVLEDIPTGQAEPLSADLRRQDFTVALPALLPAGPAGAAATGGAAGASNAGSTVGVAEGAAGDPSSTTSAPAGEFA